VVALWQERQRKQRLATLTAKSDRTIEEQAEMRDLLAQQSEFKGKSETSQKNATI
jgi:hypothetical protein